MTARLRGRHAEAVRQAPQDDQAPHPQEVVRLHPLMIGATAIDVSLQLLHRLWGRLKKWRASIPGTTSFRGGVRKVDHPSSVAIPLS